LGTRTKKRPTIADVARAADVSLMTVSRVINNKPGVGDELRQRIKALADEIGYHPSQVARGLATRQTATIGLVTPDICNQFFAYIASGAEDVAYENGYSLMLANTAEDMDREIAVLDSLWEMESEGVIICSSRLPPDELETAIGRFPAVVLVNRAVAYPSNNVATLSVNDELGAKLAMRHLLDRQRGRIAIIAGPIHSISGQRRLDGYRAALAEAGLLFDPLLIEHCKPTYDGGRAAMIALLNRRPKVDAVFAFNDLVAVGAIHALEERGKSIPEEVAIIGVDDIPLASMVRPRLSTVGTDLVELGRTAMRMILRMVNEEADGVSSIEIDPCLILRESA
jgi:LacI family transcriptional regulator